MRKIFIVGLCPIILAACRRELEIRKDPDLWQVGAREARRLQHPPVRTRYDSQVSQRSDWQLHTSLAHRAALYDGDISSVARSTDEHRLGEFVLIDLGITCHFQTVRQIHPPSGGAPPVFRVDTAGDHGFPYNLQFLGPGQPGESIATFPRPVQARFIRITIVEDSDQPWHIAELEIE